MQKESYICGKMGKYLNVNAEAGLIAMGTLCSFIDLGFRVVH